MPVVSYASVSDRPPTVIVSCNSASFTCKLALKAGSFSLSVVGIESAEAVSALATTSGIRTRDKLADSGLKHKRGRKLDVPLPETAFATLECRLISKKKFGRHLLLVGRVEVAHASDAFSDFWDFEKYRPLLYTGWRDGLSTYPGA